VGVVLLILVFMVANPVAFWHTTGEIHDSLANAFGALGVGMVILFFVGVPLGTAALAIKINQSRKVQVIPVGKYGAPPAVVIHEQTGPRVEHLSQAGQMDTAQILTALRQSMQLNVVSANALKRMSAYLEDAGQVVDELPPAGQDQLPAPKRMYKLIDVLRSGHMGNDGEYIIGYKRDGSAMCGKLFDVEDNLYNSIFTVGDQGGGKTAFAVLIAAYTIKHGGRLLIIDPEKGQKQSLTERLGPLVNRAFLLHEIADTPEKADSLLKIADAEIETPGDYPVVFLVDELSMIARQAEVNMGKWAKVGTHILSTLEDYATRGRKRIRRSVVMGQFTQGKRNGGTTLRYAMATMCFRIDKKQSQLALDQEEAEQTPTLEPGEVIVIPSRSSEPKARMKVIYPDEEALRIIAQVALEMRVVDADGRQESDDDFYGAPTVDLHDTGSENTTSWDKNSVFCAQSKSEARKVTTGELVGPVQPLKRQVPATSEGETSQVPAASQAGKSYLLTEKEIPAFLAHYEHLKSIDKALQKIGHGARYHAHASQILKERGLL
jgi:hypothetical protein